MTRGDLRPYPITRSAGTYFGAFAEPAFALLGAPAELYANLLRHLAPFGASIRSLSIDVSSVANAHVSCVINEFASVRITVTGVEVQVLLSEVGVDGAHRLVNAAWLAVRSTDSSLRPVTQTLSFQFWGRVEGETYQEMGSRLARAVGGQPPSEVHWPMPAGGPAGALEIAGVVDEPGGLFTRAVTSFGGESIEEIAPRVRVLLRGWLAELGVDAGEAI
jgi:hypothetical protein